MSMDAAMTTWPAAPFLSEADVKVEAEGSIDPLGLAPIATRLAYRLVPGIVERQRHARYLTTMAVGNIICAAFGPDALAADDRSPPWQVYEWYAVLGLVRTAEQHGDVDAIRGLPGRDKANTAIRRNMPLSAASYLKIPSVFGFHGVYRGLAEALKLTDDFGLAPAGHRLVEIWEKEQKLKGFMNGRNAAGRLRDNLKCAVADGLSSGEVARTPRWKEWSFFFDHLRPFAPGPLECDHLWHLFMTPKESVRAQVLDFVVSKEGQKLLYPMVEEGEFSERRFHQRLGRVASPELKALLEAINAYERFSRLIDDAFYDCVAAGANAAHPLAIKEFAEVEGVRIAVKQVAEAFDKAQELLEPYQQGIVFRETFSSLAEPRSAQSWTQTLFEHHENIQRRKPPNGKAPWFETHSSSRIMVRPQYRERGAGLHTDEYVGLYRTGSLWSMARDLGRVRQH